MTDDSPATDRPAAKGTRTGVRIALVSAGLAAGAIGATALGANAASNNSATTTAGYGYQSAPSGAPAAPNDGDHQRPAGPGGADPVRSDEKSVSTDIAAKLKAAALAKVPGGTVIRVETDSGDATYEAHMKKADGSLVTVKFDKDLNVTAVEDGMGK
jgi:hypothetical protein